MKPQIWKFGIVGMGSIASFHIKSLEELPNCEVVALCSSNAERAKEAGQHYHLPAFTDTAKMISEVDLDAIVICSASGYHLEPTLTAAKAGKHVICEKPLEVTVERADEMIQTCRDAGVKLGCIFQSRFKPDFMRIQKVVAEGKLGKLLLGNAYVKWFRSQEYYDSRPWRGTYTGDGGAALINQSIHTIDLLQCIMGPVESVYGKTRTLTHNIEGEDLGLAMLTFKNGALGTIEGSTSLYPGYPERLEIHGSLGGIVYEGGKITVWNVPGEEGQLPNDKPVGGSGASDPLAIDYIWHKMQLQDFVEALEADREPAINGEEGRKSLEIIRAVYESNRLGKEVKL
ncbi:MAG: Gfo/Idh/MocA family oxidoreductase [Bacteroidia bacterium]